MELVQWGSNPWGQEILIRGAWELLYLSFWAGIAFIVFHVIYSAVWLPKLAREASGAGSAAVAGIPAGRPCNDVCDADYTSHGSLIVALPSLLSTRTPTSIGSRS